MDPVELDAYTWSGLEYLESIAGPGAIAEMVESFLKDAPDRLVRMKASLEAGEWQSLSRLAHDLKSNSGTVGALQLSALAARIELMAKDGENETLAAMIRNVESLLPHVLTALEQRAKHYPS